jgi:hypothetical protein
VDLRRAGAGTASAEPYKVSEPWVLNCCLTHFPWRILAEKTYPRWPQYFRQDFENHLRAGVGFPPGTVLTVLSAEATSTGDEALPPVFGTFQWVVPDEDFTRSDWLFFSGLLQKAYPLDGRSSDRDVNTRLEQYRKALASASHQGSGLRDIQDRMVSGLELQIHRFEGDINRLGGAADLAAWISQPVFRDLSEDFASNNQHTTGDIVQRLVVKTPYLEGQTVKWHSWSTLRAYSSFHSEPLVRRSAPQGNSSSGSSGGEESGRIQVKPEVRITVRGNDELGFTPMIVPAETSLHKLQHLSGAALLGIVRHYKFTEPLSALQVRPAKPYTVISYDPDFVDTVSRMTGGRGIQIERASLSDLLVAPDDVIFCRKGDLIPPA